MSPILVLELAAGLDEPDLLDHVNQLNVVNVVNKLNQLNDLNKLSHLNKINVVNSELPGLYHRVVLFIMI